ncbi:MAG: transglycosylase domain-containing protein, partial [Longimicrobiales bacterium]
MMARAKPRKGGSSGGGLRTKLARFWYPREYLLGLGFLVALTVGGAWGTWQNLCAGDACPSIARISTFEHEQKSKILAANGEQIAEFGFESRTPIRITDLPEYVPQSVVAMEDKRFYQHGGFDPIGFARAAVGVLTFNYAGGGSTISQQLARNLFT